MQIFRWLMKHPVIILALYFLSIAAILYSMTRNSSIETGVTDAAKMLKSDSAEVDLSSAPAIEPSTLTSALVNEVPTGEIAEVASTDAAKTDEVGSSDSNESESAKESTDATETVASEETVSDEKVAAETTEEVAVQAIASTDETDTQFTEMSAEELLLMAREAYWNNGLEESAEIYQQLIAANPDVLDYKGELGNVYWRQGFPEKAASLYAEISLPMIEEGNSDKVANMVGFIGLFFPEKATEIHNVLQAGQ